MKMRLAHVILAVMLSSILIGCSAGEVSTNTVPTDAAEEIKAEDSKKDFELQGLELKKPTGDMAEMQNTAVGEEISEEEAEKIESDMLDFKFQKLGFFTTKLHAWSNSSTGSGLASSFFLASG
jgi:hypothetical protein